MKTNAIRSIALLAIFLFLGVLFGRGQQGQGQTKAEPEPTPTPIVPIVQRYCYHAVRADDEAGVINAMKDCNENGFYVTTNDVLVAGDRIVVFVQEGGGDQE